MGVYGKKFYASLHIKHYYRPNNCGHRLGELIGHNSTYILSGWCTFWQTFLLIMAEFSKNNLEKKAYKVGKPIRL